MASPYSNTSIKQCSICHNYYPSSYMVKRENARKKKGAMCHACWLEYHKTLEKERNQRATAARKARIAANGGTFTKADVLLQLKSQKHKCWWCGKPIEGDNYQTDHRIPLCRGGSNAPENIVVTCPFCNIDKGRKLPQEWNGRLL